MPCVVLLQEAQVAYTSNSALKHMVHRIRKDPTNFLKYWHNKDLVNFLNMFVNKDDELPEHWQMKLDKSGKVGLGYIFLLSLLVQIPRTNLGCIYYRLICDMLFPTQHTHIVL